jgi:hypothetical protein
MTEHLRRFDGDETWNRLRDWIKEQKASERLAASLLQTERFGVDPSHPLGGRDSGKDALCRKDGLILVAAVYFPRGQQAFKDILEKFSTDLGGVSRNNADGIVFVTNQELRLAERKKLADLAPTKVVELYHLERLTLLLNSPPNYGLRLEYLGIRISEEEYLAFLANRDEEHYQKFESISSSINTVLAELQKQAQDIIGYSTGGNSIACFFPMIWANDPQFVTLTLENKSEYPVFDIQCEYIDVDEPIEPEKGKFWTRHHVVIPSIYPHKVILNAIIFDMTNKSRLRINLWIQTRTRSVQQLFRMARVGDRIHIAVKTDSEDFSEVKIPTEYPDYDPANPDKVFS